MLAVKGVIDVKKIGSSFLQRMTLGLVFVLIFSYTVYHLISLFGADISTFAAGITTESTSLHYNGYLFRDETVLTSPLGGVVEYHVEDGTKVSKNQPVATVYEDGTLSTRTRLQQIDEQIAILEQSTGAALKGLDIGEVKAAIGDTYGTLINMLASGESGGLLHRSDQLLVYMNQLKELTERSSQEEPSQTSGEAILAGLKAEREALLLASGNAVAYQAEQSGYFYSETDGYEAFFTMDAARELTVESFARLTSGELRSDTEEGQIPYGKLCTDVSWMLVISVKASEKEYFQIGQAYEGHFEENNQAKIPLTLMKVVEDDANGRALLVFQGDRMPEHFSFDRSQSVRIEVSSISGIYVPKSVVQRVDGYRGVYILRGSVVYFRCIEIVYEGSDYYLVKENVEDEEDYAYLKVNDRIILNGKNLFDGRVLD